MNAEKTLEQGGHILHQPRGVAITCNFFFDMHVFSGADKKGTGAEKL